MEYRKNEDWQSLIKWLTGFHTCSFCPSLAKPKSKKKKRKKNASPNATKHGVGGLEAARESIHRDKMEEAAAEWKLTLAVVVVVVVVIPPVSPVFAA